jgi:hypothetical protein
VVGVAMAAAVVSYDRAYETSSATTAWLTTMIASARATWTCELTIQHQVFRVRLDERDKLIRPQPAASVAR